MTCVINRGNMMPRKKRKAPLPPPLEVSKVFFDRDFFQSSSLHFQSCLVSQNSDSKVFLL